MHAEYAPQPGQLLGGKYRISRTLGRGAMGVVYEAEQVATGKRVAVKWLHADVMQSRSAVERLVREAQASARVRHSNVVDVYDVEREGNALFLVMEYLEGEPLSQWLDRGGVPMHELLSVIVQAMRGVSEAHRRGIVHRDIKPDNIFLSYEPDQPHPVAKVLDFGISKIDAPGGLSLTQTGSALGTPLYMSYEQLSGLRDVDARSDVYGFGVILYEALTGTLPYSAENFAELAAKVITSEPIPPRQIRPDIPERLEQVVLWCMKKRREERAPNLSLVIDALVPFTQPSGQHPMSLSSARLPAVREVTSQPLSSTPAPPPSSSGLRLNEPGGWDGSGERSRVSRRDGEDRIPALIAGTMYEGRRKRSGSGGTWMAILGGIGAIAVGVVLATVTRNSESGRPEEQAPVSAPAVPEPAVEPKPATAAVEPENEPSQPAPGATVERSPEVLAPLAPTQVEAVQQVPPFNAVRPDAGAAATAPAQAAVQTGAQPGVKPGAKPGVKASPRPSFSPPSGELSPPPIITPADLPDAIPPGPAPSGAPYEPPPAPDPPEPEVPRAPVDVNPFEGDDPSGDTYRAGRPREDEF